MRQAQRLQLRIQIAAHAAIGSQVKLLLLSDKKIPYNPFGLYGISSIYLLQIILLPQSQHPVHCHCFCLNPDLHCCLPDLR